ncbi:MAG: ABC transporter permease, partial [Candidatus Aminicenantes bacterium]|nr:ABC transporter permease [Candidatus Aminicenantes bacterium]
LVRYERSYDAFFDDAERIYRVADDDYSRTAANLSQALKQEFPEIKYAARVVKINGFLRNDKGLFHETEIQCVDPEFFNIFSYPLFTGLRPDPLDQPFQVLITVKTAARLFGQIDPVGQTLNYNNLFDFVVTGVLKDIPENTHMKFDMLTSMLTYKALLGPEYENFLSRWGSNDFWTYLQLQDNVSPAQMENKVPQFEEKYKDREKLNLFLQPVQRIHISGNLRFEMETNTDSRTLVFLSTIAVLILLIACFNFMNLATAQVTTRSKEVGLRKVVGSSRWQLIRQFFGESLLFAGIAMGITLLIVKLSIPVFNSFMQRNLEFRLFNDTGIILFFLGTALFTGLVSGCYPALFLSFFQPMRILKSGKYGSKKSLVFRNILVVFQFSINIFLIFSSLVVFNQLRFLKEKSFANTDNPIVNISISDAQLRANPLPLENELKNNTQILDLTSSYNLPISIPVGNNVSWDGQTEEEKFIIRQTNVDYNFTDFYGIEIINGRTFSKTNTTDKTQAVLINETAAKRIGWGDPIGKQIHYGSNHGMVIIGVMKDFNFKPLYNEIEPLAVSLLEDSGYFGGVNFISVKINAEHISQTLKSIEKSWDTLSSEYPFSYSFLDEQIEARYRTEQKMGQSIAFMAIIAIFLACLGIFGLSLFTVDEKTKEIGIRKVLGATASSIFFILSKEFIKWVVLGAALSFPVAWMVMKKWLQNFAYRTHIGPNVFVYALMLSVLVAFLAVSVQSIRAALGNPVKAIRHE